MSGTAITETDVLACVANGEPELHGGYQGDIYTGRVGDENILVKSAAGRSIAAWLNRRMLRREYRIYCHLKGVNGIPHCFGFFSGRYLALEHIESQTLRHGTINDRDAFFAEMLTLIKSVHERDVAHGDLKRKNNILVTHDSHPYLIDFGVSTIRKPGFHPLNHIWHSFCYQHDLNAWLKHKYGGNFQAMSAEDAQYYRPLLIERIARVIKRAWTKMKKVFKPAHA